MNVPRIEAILARRGIADTYNRNLIANEIMDAIEAEEAEASNDE